jgi:hypothetical protein
LYLRGILLVITDLFVLRNLIDSLILREIFEIVIVTALRNNALSDTA